MNNPLNNIDPNGLDCAYLNDSGTAVEYIDHQGTGIGECQGNGGYWANGTIFSSADVIVNRESDIALIYSYVGGAPKWSISTPSTTFGAYDMPSLGAAGTVPTAGGSLQNPSKAAAIALPLVACQLAEPCGIGVDSAVIGAALIAAGAYATKLTYNHFSSEQSRIRAAANQAGLTYAQLSEYLHSFKEGPHGAGRGPGDNFTWEELVAIAAEAAQWYASHKQ